MEKILHRAFMDANKLSEGSFSKAVAGKIGVFDKMLDRLEDTVGEDKKKLRSDLKELDHEILQDMLSEMEDELENNELPEEKQEAKKETPASPVPDSKSKSDEALLDELWKMKRTKGLSRSFLQGLGIKKQLGGWEVEIGGYRLIRTAVFSYTYELEKK